MRILFVIEGIQESCGISRFVIETVRELLVLGHEAAIVSTKNWNVPANDLRIFETQNPESSASEFRPDIVHLHGCWNGYVHRMAKWCQTDNVPYVFSPHGAWTPWALEFHKWKKRVAWWLFQKKDCQYASSFHVTVQSELDDVKRFRFNQPIIVAPLGVRFSQNKLPEVGQREKILLYLGRLHEKKNVHGLLTAWKRLPAHVRIGWKLVIAGKTGPDNAEYLPYLQSLADDTCTFVGEVMGKAKEQLYQQARLFILPSFSENFGAVVLEALAAGTPVIATTGTPWQDLVTHGCGWWCDSAPDYLKTALETALSTSPQELQAMSQNALEFVSSTYSWKHTAELLLDTYLTCLKGKPNA